MTGLERRDFVKAAGAAGAGLALPGAANALETVSSELDTDGGLQEVIVVFRDRDDVDLLDAFDLAEGRFDYSVLPMSWTFLTGDQISAVAEDDRVLRVSDVFELEYYNDPESRQAMHLEASDGSRAVDFEGDGIDAVVIDSGIDGAHPDFRGRVESNYEYVDEPFGDRDPEMWVDIGNGDSDDIGHGTHCAGILAGDGSASEAEPSTPSYQGMAPKARLSCYSVSQGIYLPYAVGAWDHMIDRKLHDDSFDPVVCSNSYGVARGNRYNPLDPLNVATWEAFEAGILPVFAAGNDGPGKGTLNRYAKAPHVLGVAAGTKEKGVTDFSSRGWNDGDELPEKAGGATVDSATHHDRDDLLGNLADLMAVARGGGLTVASGTLSGQVGPGLNAPYAPAGASTDASTHLLKSGANHENADFPERADRISGTLSLQPDGQQVQVSFYRLYESDDGDSKTDRELIARMGEEPVYIHKDIAFDITGKYDIEVEFLPKNAAGASYSFDYEITDLVTFKNGSYTGHDLDAYRPHTLYRPGLVTHGNLVMSTVDPHDALSPIDTSTDGAVHPLYSRFSGTSMACPAAAGIAALVIQAGRKKLTEKTNVDNPFVGYSDAQGDDDRFSPADVIYALEKTATENASDIEQVNYTVAGAGTGFVDAAAAVAEAADGSFPSYSNGWLVDSSLAEALKVTGTRDDDGSAFTGGQTNHVTVTVTELSHGATVYDLIPKEWRVTDGATPRPNKDAPDGMKAVELGTADPISGADDTSETFDYYVEVPSDPAATGRYALGPAFAEGDASLDEPRDSFGGQDGNNVVVGQRQP